MTEHFFIDNPTGGKQLISIIPDVVQQLVGKHVLLLLFARLRFHYLPLPVCICVCEIHIRSYELKILFTSIRFMFSFI